MASDREQELARTATAAASAPAEPTEPVGATLGRYRLERELGAGAMGVVHAAFDPDLERRIALKVLRGATATTQARDRLLREARAMARLSHPNVVTVHEVGTAGGRDFVAMELIHGETLADWLRAARRTPAAILDAFLAAGRGLAAAHAAGIVHRDFKPRNVLRSRDGRIAVTDFGLARDTHVASPLSLDATLPLGTEGAASRSSGSDAPRSSPLAGLTVTGALLGTPAYMAPEQWGGGAVAPATDQFAFCVALWEALAGQRPYPGPTLDDLRAQVARGPAALDASRIPRRVRGLLRRGLDPDPARRWPSMNALLTRLVRVHRQPWVALAIAGGALVAAVALVLASRGGEAPIALCDPPARGVASVWSPALRAELAAKASDGHVAVFDTAYWSWRAARGAACTAPLQVRQYQLACLDGVLARFDALRQAAAVASDSSAEDVQANLVDPAVCRKPAAADIPRLTLTPTPGVISAFALLVRSEAEHKPSDADLAAPAGASNPDACARVIAALAFDAVSNDVARDRTVLADAIGSADQCGDERLRADLLIEDIPFHWELPMVGPRGDAAMRQARIAAARVMQTEVEARLAGKAIYVVRQRGQWDEAFRLAEARLAGYRARGLPHHVLRAVIDLNYLRISRSDPGDLDRISADVRTWRPVAFARHEVELVRRLDVLDALARLTLGDVEHAHADLVALWRTQPPISTAGTRRITGEVVDPRGRPVAGASVAAAGNLVADSVGIGLPTSGTFDAFQDDLRIATSDAAGRFVIDAAAPTGTVAAQHGDLRSLPVMIADRVKLVLAPTRRITGKVELGGLAPTRVFVHATPDDSFGGRFRMYAPIAADGSFALDGAPVGAVWVGAGIEGGELAMRIESQRIAASAAPVSGLVLHLTQSDRTIDVIVRSTVTAPLGGAQVLLVPGKHAITKASELMHLPAADLQYSFAKPVVGEDIPRAVRGAVHRDDLIAHIEHATLGDLTVCAVGFSDDLLDPESRRRFYAHLAEFEVKCEHIGPATELVTLVTPPQQRYD
ncbi:MAG TPA: serine/threonine-protein kinase [Kofleriaceae bacterium]|nr:serine/threonine-protein kinase [Kofleriaceae bacterium]